MTGQHISDLISGNERELIIRALQALWRERISAYNLACDLKQSNGKRLKSEDFGVPEVEDALRKWGATTQKY